MSTTTRKDFPAILPKTKTEYCWDCKSETVSKVMHSEKTMFYCSTCKHTGGRILIYDPKMKMWFNENDELIHESSGVLLLNENNKLLLFQRTKFPFLLTIPAGHVEVNEDTKVSALRETEEEVNITLEPDAVRKVFEGELRQESCLGGADIHSWSAYSTKINADDVSVKLDAEGSSWGWYDIEELNETNTVTPVLQLLKKEEIDKLFH